MVFYPRFKILRKIIDKTLYLLYMNEEFKRAFTFKAVISYRSSLKISSYLVRAKLYPINGTVFYYKCGRKRCEVCKYITETYYFYFYILLLLALSLGKRLK